MGKNEGRGAVRSYQADEEGRDCLIMGWTFAVGHLGLRQGVE